LELWFQHRSLIIESSLAMLKEAWNQKTASKGAEHTNLISGCIIFLVTQAFSELFGVDSNNNEWEQSRHFTHLSELLDDEAGRFRGPEPCVKTFRKKALEGSGTYGIQSERCMYGKCSKPSSATIYPVLPRRTTDQLLLESMPQVAPPVGQGSLQCSQSRFSRRRS
jgi:hypothetical protein